jgi:hypothetical protein
MRLERRSSPEPARLHEVEAKWLSGLPRDYLDFISKSDGGTWTGERHLLLYSIDDLESVNAIYASDAPYLVFIGSDGGGLGYAYDRNKRCFVAIHFMDLGAEDPELLAPTFDGFLDQIGVPQ